MFGHARHHRRLTQIPPSQTEQLHKRLPSLFSSPGPSTPDNPTNESNPTTTTQLHTRLSTLFSSPTPDDLANSHEEEPLPSDEDSEALPRTTPIHNYRHSTGSSLALSAEKYSRAMHAHHTMTSAAAAAAAAAGQGDTTLPGYNRTMHAFTLGQLNHMDNTGSHNPSAARADEASAAKAKAKAASHLASSPPALALKLPPSQSRTQYLSRSLSMLNQFSLDEEPCGPSNTPEPGEEGVAKPPAPTSGPDMGETEMETDGGEMGINEAMLAQGRELEARFEELMRGGGAVGGVGGVAFGSEARDFAGGVGVVL